MGFSGIGIKIVCYATSMPAFEPKSKALAHTRRATEAFRELTCPEFWYAWLYEVAMGNDPAVTLRDFDPQTNRKRTGPESRPGISRAITMSESMSAAKAILERAYGTPEQSLRLEASVQAKIASVSVQATLDELSKLPPEVQASMRNELRSALSRARILPAGQDDSDSNESNDDTYMLDDVADDSE